VREVNREVQALRGVFVGSRVISVGHTGKALPAGTRAFASAAPIRSLETQGRGAVVSVLAKGDRRFLVVVNREINQPMGLRVTLDLAAAAKRVGKDGTLSPVERGIVENELPPGDVAILTWTEK
jgi:hypothetical protein